MASYLYVPTGSTTLTEIVKIVIPLGITMFEHSNTGGCRVYSDNYITKSRYTRPLRCSLNALILDGVDDTTATYLAMIGLRIKFIGSIPFDSMKCNDGFIFYAKDTDRTLSATLIDFYLSVHEN